MLSMHEPLKIRITAQFKKDLKTARKQKKPMDRLDRIVSVLQSRGELAPRYKETTPSPVAGTATENATFTLTGS